MAREKIILRCVDCKNENYITKKNKKLHPDKIEQKKHCKKCIASTIHREKK